MNRQLYPWTAFGVFVGAGIVALFLAMPRPLQLLPLLAAVAILIVLVGVGLRLAKDAGLRASMLDSSSASAASLPQLARIGGQSIVIGAGLGMGLLLAIRFVIRLVLPAIQARFTAEAEVAVWKRVVIAFDSAILEEVAFRLFLFSLLVWLAGHVWPRPGNAPSLGIRWAVNALIAIGFGVAHLPNWSQITTLTPLVIGSVVLLNGIGGLTFGYLYFEKGLEAAMLAHFAADIVLHVIGPGLLKT